MLVAGGKPVSEVARLAGASRQSVYNWLRQYAASRRAEALRDGPARAAPAPPSS